MNIGKAHTDTENSKLEARKSRRTTPDAPNMIPTINSATLIDPPKMRFEGFYKKTSRIETI